MMNKYSLKFKYSQLENQYVLQRQTKITAPLFQTAALCVFVISTYRLILLIMEKKLDLLPILAACSLFTFVSLILFQFKIRKVNLQLIILAYLLLGYEFLITSDTSFESYELYISNFSCCSIIIMLMLEFTDSIFVFTTCNSFKLIYTIIIDSKRSYTTYASTVLLTMFLCYFSHKINIQSRLSFLLSQQDYMWESIFPRIIEKPYIILSFNQDRIEFSYKSSSNLFFQCINNDQLKEFLREWKYQQKSLEILLYQSYQDSKQTDLKTSSFEVQNEKKEKLRIKFAIFPATSSIFLSLEKQQQRSELSVQVQKIQLQYQKLFINQLEQILKVITASLKQKKFVQLYSLRNKFFSQILYFQIRTQIMKIEEFDSVFLIEAQELFEQKGLKIIFEQNTEINQKVFFPQNYFQILLFEVCKAAFKNTQLQIKFGNVLLISYIGKKIKFGKNPYILKVWHAIVESYKINKNFKQILLYKDASIKFGAIKH